jgi:hypothetical protein
MGDEQQSRVQAAVELEHELADPLAGCGVQISGWLVGEQHSGSGHESAGECHPLLLTAGQLTRIVPGSLGKAHLTKGLERGGACGGVAGQLQGQHDVLECGQRGNEMECLKYKAHTLSTQSSSSVFVESGQILPVQDYPSAAR